MGVYMSKPSTEKLSSSGYNDWLAYGVSSMQGWRMQQEDAHNCQLEFDQSRDASFFAVYDGHGGSEVARYCAEHFPDFLRQHPSWASGADTAVVLKQLFVDFDASLTTPECKDALCLLSADSDKEAEWNVKQSDDDDDDEHEMEISALRAEANQPLEHVLERYGGEEALPSDIKNLLDTRRRNRFGECSTSTHSEEKSDQSTEPAKHGDGPSETEASKESVPGLISASEPNSSTDTSSARGTTGADAKGDVEFEAQPTGSESGDAEHITENDNEDEDDSEDESVELNDEDEDDDDDDSEENEEDSQDDDSSEDDNVVEGGLDRFPFTNSKDSDDTDPGVESGSTACVALLVPKDQIAHLYVANAGDSRAVLCRGGSAVDLSVDHKPDDEDEKARIYAAGGTVTRDGRVNGGLNLSRALGDHSYKKTKDLPLTEQMITPSPDVTHFELIPDQDEFMVVACDGVWNSMTSQEVISFVHERLQQWKSTNLACGNGDDVLDTNNTNSEDYGTNPTKLGEKLSSICEEIFDHCLAPNTDGDGTGCDNMTCIIVSFYNLPALLKKRSTTAPAGMAIESRKRSSSSSVAAVAPNGVQKCDQMTENDSADLNVAKRSRIVSADVSDVTLDESPVRASLNGVE